MGSKALGQLERLAAGVSRLYVMTGEPEERRASVGGITIVVGDQDPQSDVACAVLHRSELRNLDDRLADGQPHHEFAAMAQLWARTLPP